MRGIIIKKGLIGADDGKYFTYEGYENLDVGDEVDFEASDDGKAREIFLIKKAYYSSENSAFGGGNNSENSAFGNSSENSAFGNNSENSAFGNNSENSGFGGELGSAKLFGVIGSITGLFSAVLYVGWFFAFCAFLLMLLALHNVAKISGSSTIFVNYLKGIVANFVGIGFIWLGVILGAVLFFTSGSGGIIGIFVGLFGAFLLAYAFVKWIKTYFELSDLSGNNMFKYFAIIYIIGVCSTWLFGLGYIIMGIAFALQAFGWWQISALKKAF